MFIVSFEVKDTEIINPCSYAFSLFHLPLSTLPCDQSFVWPFSFFVRVSCPISH